MRSIYFLTICIFCNLTVKAQDTSARSEKALIMEASYTCDNLYNIKGGLKTGYAYLGMAQITMSFDMEKAELWKKGLLYIKAANTHGAIPSVCLTGDLQVASNIEAGNHTYIQELWYQQEWGKTKITVGLQDLNVEFAITDFGALFLNSSFGISPIISGNISAPVFPLTTPGITVKWDITKKSRWVNAIYDGCPTDFSDNPHNIRWEFLSGDGLLAISEFQNNIVIGKFPGTIKMGIYSHNNIIEKHFHENFPDSLTRHINGMYAQADQKIWEKGKSEAGIFIQAGYSPSESSNISTYLGTGLNLTGCLSKKSDDILGFAIAYVRIKPHSESETCIEITWKKEINDKIYIQPDFQYIINPSGKSSNLKNCLTGILRFGLSF